MSEPRRERTRLEAAALGIRFGAALARRFADGADPALAAALAFPAAFAEMTVFTEDRLAAARARSPGHPLDHIAVFTTDGAILAPLALLACLPEVHEGFATLCRLLHRDGRPEATVGLALDWLETEAASRDVFDLRDRVESVLLHDPVAALNLVRCDGDGPWHGRALLPGPGLWAALNARAPQVDGLEVLAGFRAVPGLETWLEQPDAERAMRAMRDGVPAVIGVSGETSVSRSTRVRAMLGRTGLAAVRARLDGSETPAARGRITRDAYTVALLHGTIPWLDLEGDTDAAPPVLPRGLAPGLPMLVTAQEERALPSFDLPALSLRLTRLPATARRRMWGTLLPQLVGSAGVLAARYPVDPEEARGIVADLALRQVVGSGPLGDDDIAACMRARTATHTRPGVRRVIPRTKWTDLLLPPAAAAQLTDAVTRVRHQLTVLDDWGFDQGRGDRGGLRLLFHGPPGTGKTLAAEAMAKALGFDLLVADIAGLVSKWIGETEKNLAAVFELAERARAVLLFDEADALFGRRTEASDAHDRYANMETAFLLQRLERFEGVAILATNLRGALDAAFTRRFDDIIAFVDPHAATRVQLWRMHLPATAPLAPDVDLHELAEWYVLSGAQIRNACLGAAYLAAAGEESGPVSIGQRHMLTAVAREFEKAGRAWPGTPPARAHDGQTRTGATAVLVT